jgi:hypothetical protein
VKGRVTLKGSGSFERAPDLQLEKNSSHQPLRQPGPLFYEYPFAHEVPPLFMFFYKVTSHFKLIVVNLQEAIKTNIQKKGRDWQHWAGLVRKKRPLKTEKEVEGLEVLLLWTQAIPI